jgi:hypothetical protein
MLCTFCNTARLANEAPCPQCGAPSPLIAGANGTYGNLEAPMPPPMMWGSPPSPFSNVQVSNQVQQVLPQTPQVQQQSTLPVPYQPQQALSTMPPGTLTAGMEGTALLPIPTQNLSALVAALPEEAGVIYVPPMYTKPRPIIPRYRVISGLLSVLIVTFLLCVGTGYYVKASGKLATLGQLYGVVPPPNVKPIATVPLKDPPTTQQTGPAYGIINSATTTSRINSQHVAQQQDTVFRPGQSIYLTYSVQHPKAPGVVVIKWYTNGLFYQSNTTRTITGAITGYTEEVYVQPAEGMVELYWNNQLAIRLYFVVR